MLIPFSGLYEKVQLVLTNKIEEFHYYGYNAITEQDLWRYCIDKVWRKQDVQNLRIHEVASGIFSASASKVLSYMQITEFKQTEMNSKLSEDELHFLLQPTKK